MGGALSWPPGLTSRDFARLSKFIEERSGIRMPMGKATLIESRLRKRVQELGMKSFTEYCDLVLSGRSPDELVFMIDRITTNKTEFFRESPHFEILVHKALPALAAAEGAGIQRELRVWSAGCSTGEEPYTLAMVLAEAAAAEGREVRFEILATDLSSSVLRHAREALYNDEQAQAIPLALRKKYLLRSLDDEAVVRVRKSLRSLVSFRKLNLLDKDYGLPSRMDVVFCRNVFIYFDRKLQAEILRRFAQNMVPGGFLFLGHSENINGLDVPFTLVAPTVFRRIGDSRR